MKVFSLFAGIGAPEAALDRLGIDYELVGFSEIDKFAPKSYCAIHNEPISKNYGDITKIDEKEVPEAIDLITYGFPEGFVKIYQTLGNRRGFSMKMVARQEVGCSSMH